MRTINAENKLGDHRYSWNGGYCRFVNNGVLLSSTRVLCVILFAAFGLDAKPAKPWWTTIVARTLHRRGESRTVIRFSRPGHDSPVPVTQFNIHYANPVQVQHTLRKPARSPPPFASATHPLSPTLTENKRLAPLTSFLTLTLSEPHRGRRSR